MASDPIPPAAPPADPLSELRALLPEAITALGGVALTGLAAALVPTPKGPEVNPFDLERLEILLRYERQMVGLREQELEELRRKLRATEDEADQLRRADRASAKDAEQHRRLRRRVAWSSGASEAQDPELKTYAWCREFKLLPKTERPSTSRAQRAQYLRVAGMPLDVGEALDKAGVPFRWIRYVAYGSTAFEQRVRAAQVLAGCRPRRQLRIFRDLSEEVREALIYLDLEEDGAPALIRQLIQEGRGEAFVGR